MNFPEYYFSTYERFTFDYQCRIADMFDDEQMNDDELSEFAENEIQYDLENVLFDICSLVAGEIVMADGTGAARMFDDLSDFFDYIEYDELMIGVDGNGNMIVTCITGDGSDVLTIRELTVNGEEYVKKSPSRNAIEYAFRSDDLSRIVNPYQLTF